MNKIFTTKRKQAIQGGAHAFHKISRSFGISGTNQGNMIINQQNYCKFNFI
jgi:hypothetical protein